MNAPDPGSEVLEFMRRYGNAYRENNVAELRALRHPDFIFTSSRGWRIATDDGLAEIASGNSRVNHSAVHQMDAPVFGDTAVATGNIWLEGIWKGAPYSRELAITAALIRSSPGWLMVAEHSSRVVG